MASTSTQGQAANKPVVGYPIAYRYEAPPPPPPVGPAYHQNYQDPRNGSALLCRMIVVAVVVFSLMGLVSFISWLVLRPQVPEFRVDSASVSQLNTTSTSLTATWLLSLSVKNPNTKLSISYDSLRATVFFQNSELGATHLAPFRQHKRNQTTLKFQLGVLSEYVPQTVVKDIQSQKAHGEVGFGVALYGWVRFRAGWWQMRWRWMRVYCNDVKIATTGSLLGQVKPCRVDI